MARLGVFTDPHGLEHARLIADIFDLEGIAQGSRMCLGDIAYETASSYTLHEGNRALQLRHMLGRRTKLRDDVKKGVYSDEQLERIVGAPYSKAWDAAESGAKSVMEQYAALFPEAKWLLGNWDRESQSEVVGDKHLNGTTSEVEGLKVLGLSGGGSAPVSSLAGGLAADDGAKELYHHQQWARPTVQAIRDGVDLVASHVPPLFRDDAEHIDIAERHLEEIIRQGFHVRRQNPALSADEKSKPLPWFWGHKHTATKVGFETYGKDTVLSITPGVSAWNHNDGPHASFIIAEFDDNRKLSKVQEYRIYNSVQGLREVEFHGEHQVDYAAKKVTFAPMRKTLLKEHDIGSFAGALNADKDVSLFRRGFRTQYDGLSAWKKDQQLRLNLTLADDYAREFQTKVRQIVNGVRRDLLRWRDAKAVIPFEDLNQAIDKVYGSLAAVVAEDFHLNVDGKSPEDKKFIYDTLMMFSLNMGKGEVRQSLLPRDTSVESIAGEWGLELANLVMKNVRGRYQQYSIEHLEAEDFQAMAEEYMPVDVERVHTTSRADLREAINLWHGSTFRSGLVSSPEALATRWYRKNEETDLNPKSDQDIAAFIGDENVDLEKSYLPLVRELPKELQDIMKEKINAGELPVLRDEEGDYVMLGPGKNAYLDDTFRETVKYEPITPEMLMEKQSKLGDGRLVRPWDELEKLGDITPPRNALADYQRNPVADLSPQPETRTESGLVLPSGSDVFKYRK